MNASAFSKVDKAAFYRFILGVPDHERYEYVRGLIVQQQQGGTKRHGRIAGRIAEICRRQLDPDQWDVLEGRGLETAETIRFGDIVVEPRDEPDDSLASQRPVLIVEVLSPSSGDRDLTTKPDEYTSIASLRAYVVASQDEPECLVWVRGVDGAFNAEPLQIAGIAQSIEIADLELTISLAEVYGGLSRE